ncbi:putative mitochondrial carrierc [Vanrija pseudolonga]|uniref:Purtative mitochondrial carrierc n=1 Tax=Vanrija pseudolonga TaxID=143232 RepID=A0AAF0Y2G9_9TREE|nr:purtative mitochondrial carrierc [Vanrija pseudolonga]
MGLSQTQKDLVGGSVGGVAQVLVGQPFDIVKVRVQTAAPGTFSSPLDCATKLLKNEGLLGFYKGTLTPLLGIGACVSIQFGALEWAKRQFAARAGARPLSLAELYASGAIAGVANTAVAGPVEHIRIRLQTQPADVKLYNGPLDCARKLWAHGGPRGLFKGQVATMWRDGVGYGCYFLAYEYLVQRYTRNNNISREQISPLVSLGFGASAGFALWFSIYPIDVVKSKLQTDALEPSKRKYTGMLDCFAKTWRAQGVKGFLGGLEPTLVRSPFANGATFVAFELAMRAMGSEEKVDAPPDLIV